MDYFIDPSLWEDDSIFMLLLENNAHRTGHISWFLTKAEIKDYNVIIDDEHFYQLRTYGNIGNTATGQGDNCTTGCLLDYLYFKENYEMIAINLSKR